MDIFFTIIALIFVYKFIIKGFFANNVHQINISPVGINFKIPRALLELANIDNNHDVAYSELSKEEQVKFNKIHEKLNDIAWCTLTYIDSHDLIHIQKSKTSYFHKVSNDNPYLIHEEIGKTKEYELHFVLYRKNNGLLKGSILIGYLLKQKPLGTKEEVIPLFEFPERLIRWNLFTKGLQNQYKLKQDTVADYIDKDELGYSRSLYMVSYDTTDKDKTNFWFRIF